MSKSIASNCGWQTYATPGVVGNDQGSNNSTNLTIRPGGYRSGYDGEFDYAANYQAWLMTTTLNGSYIYRKNISFSTSTPLYYQYEYKDSGLSVRCVRDTYDGWENDLPFVTGKQIGRAHV